MESAGLRWSPVDLFSGKVQSESRGVCRNMAYSGRLHWTGLANLACVTLKKSGWQVLWIPADSGGIRWNPADRVGQCTVLHPEGPVFDSSTILQVSGPGQRWVRLSGLPLAKEKRKNPPHKKCLHQIVSYCCFTINWIGRLHYNTSCFPSLSPTLGPIGQEAFLSQSYNFFWHMQ